MLSVLFLWVLICSSDCFVEEDWLHEAMINERNKRTIYIFFIISALNPCRAQPLHWILYSLAHGMKKREPLLILSRGRRNCLKSDKLMATLSREHSIYLPLDFIHLEISYVSWCRIGSWTLFLIAKMSSETAFEAESFAKVLKRILNEMRIYENV